MKTTQLICLLAVLTALSSSVCKAMYFAEGSIAEITAAPDHQVYGREQSFAVCGSTAVWLDYRDPMWIPRVYGVRLDDPNFQEFAIDTNAADIQTLAFCGHRAVYPVWPLDKQYLRVADISDPGSPVLADIGLQIPSLLYFDYAGGLIAYAGDDQLNSWRDTIYAVDASELNNPQTYTVYVEPDEVTVYGLTAEAGSILWYITNYNELTRSVRIADVSNPQEPVIRTAVLPGDYDRYWTHFEVSGSWLVASEGWPYRILGVHNYQDTDNWQIQVLWQEGQDGEQLVSGPRIDGPIAVWITTTRMPALAQMNGTAGLYQYRLKAAYLMDNGHFTVWTLLESETDELLAADISGRQVVWSVWNRQTELIDLFKGTLELQCGDWGYKAGDLDKNCFVNLLDLVLMAQDWLACTDPQQPECGFGL
ncbi:MAG TPA: hypothetical protein P5175_09840 [Anaerohalosphaeraceae bacterium]|nr:hypothetical protein [Anaerohalosphaeraceae bacterium]HOM76600.1 hypothetical protein [Anaerohalosphaeraceae bacterium]HPC64025.1 hypothetical protein [Anaerohalosphaeraceae bacterium]HPO70313.1 hypothetical protein [Anaerohalosphaeraceae bacterium]HRS72135.1 hypothetical protein [Anaerohalosphaeraceae bacterium]